MIKHTHGEKWHAIRGMGLARRKQKPCKRSVLRKSCTFIEIFFRNRLTKSRRDGKIYRQSAVAVKIESGRVPEWPMGTDCKSAAFQLRWFESTRAHQEIQHPNRVLDLLFCRNFFRAERADSNSCGAVAEDSAKTAPVQQRRPLPAAETGRSCWGCGQQDARAAQGTMQPLGAATRTPYSARLAQSTRAHQEVQYPNRVLDFLFCGNFFRAGREEGKCEKQSPVLAQARRVC